MAHLRRPPEPAPYTIAVAAVCNLTLNWSDISLSSISRPEEAATWQNMVAIKSNILKRMDTAPIGVRVCCIKLLQRVVQVQTPGLISDPRVRRWPSPFFNPEDRTEVDMYAATGA